MDHGMNFFHIPHMQTINLKYKVIIIVKPGKLMPSAIIGVPSMRKKDKTHCKKIFVSTTLSQYYLFQTLVFANLIKLALYIHTLCICCA